MRKYFYTYSFLISIIYHTASVLSLSLSFTMSVSLISDRGVDSCGKVGLRCCIDSVSWVNSCCQPEWMLKCCRFILGLSFGSQTGLCPVLTTGVDEWLTDNQHFLQGVYAVSGISNSLLLFFFLFKLWGKERDDDQAGYKWGFAVRWQIDDNLIFFSVIFYWTRLSFTDCGLSGFDFSPICNFNPNII